MTTTNNIKPILFSTEMVQAILAGRKTQTRRIVQLDTGQLVADTVEQISSKYFFFQKENEAVAGRSPKYQIGDILWVRETWQKNYNKIIGKWDPIFKADGGFWIGDDGPMKWKPSLFMPKEACRIFLKVTNVRCERLQDISCEDCKDEGVTFHKSGNIDVDDILALEAFMNLWDSINAKKAPWKSNPWVWVYEFEVTEKPENFLS